PGAGRAPRHRGAEHRGGEHAAAREGPDVEVAAAPWPLDAAGAAPGVYQRARLASADAGVLLRVGASGRDPGSALHRVIAGSAARRAANSSASVATRAVPAFSIFCQSSVGR